AVLLVDVERVHVGAKRDRTLARSIALEGADDAGAGEAAMDLDAELGQSLCNDIGGAMLLKSGLRMGMGVAPPGGEGGAEGGDAVDDRHGSLSRCVGRSRRDCRPDHADRNGASPGSAAYRQ